MYRISFLLMGMLLALGCKNGNIHERTWHYTKSYPLTNVHPMSITGDQNHLFVSSGLKTELHKMNYDGGLIEAIKNIRKPKYINLLAPGEVLVAESEAHVATRVSNQESINTVPTNEFLDTPYGISASGNSLVITDYFKNRIYYNKSGKVMSFGKPGVGEGEFNGPTDIQMMNGMIYVSDSRNNRVQVFDEDGKFKQSIGEMDKIKMAGGIYVTTGELAVTDYQGDRVLVYDLSGKLKQVLAEQFDQPSDVFIRGNEMFITNFYANNIAVFTRF